MKHSDVEQLANQLMRAHNLVSWRFEFDRANRRAGCCHHSTKSISLSYSFVVMNDESEVKDTILHEIAHALAGRGHGHNDYWKQICVRIGARPNRCYDTDIVSMPKGKYVAHCPTCQKEYNKHRAFDSCRTYYCRYCGPRNGHLVFKPVNELDRLKEQLQMKLAEVNGTSVEVSIPQLV